MKETYEMGHKVVHRLSPILVHWKSTGVENSLALKDLNYWHCDLLLDKSVPKKKKTNKSKLSN